MRTVVYSPPSSGCEVSALVIAEALMPALQACDGTINVILVPPRTSREEMANHPSASGHVDCAIFMEQILEHPALLRARYRILVPNPEWIAARTEALAAHCTHMWHKSRFSLERLTPVFPQAQHACIGFTSPDPDRRVEGYDSFVHLRGHAATQRNTDSIFNAWKAAPDWPDLHVHFYLQREGGLDYPGWLSDRNVHVRMGWVQRPEYLQIAGRHGIHLCTSEVEGFGHYINEARAMAALIVAVDAPPMNELVDDELGILVRPSSCSPMLHSIRHAITAEDLAAAVERVLSLDPADRRALGAVARRRYEEEGRSFRERVQAQFAALASS